MSDLRSELVTLSFITRGGNWVFLLLSRVAEPLMFLSVLYVIAETVLPGLFKTSAATGISSASIVVLNTAPEVILPGCFMQAQQAERQAGMFRTMGVTFLILTFITLASFIWSFPPAAVSVILFFRCGASVVYSLIVRMVPQTNARVRDEQIESLQVSQRELQRQIDGFPQLVAETANRLCEQRITIVCAEIENQIQERLQALAAQISELQERVSRPVPPKRKPAETKPLHLVRSRSKKNLKESTEERIRRYLCEQRELGHTPSLNEITKACRCSRSSAIRYRGQASEQPGGEAVVQDATDEPPVRIAMR